MLVHWTLIASDGMFACQAFTASDGMFACQAFTASDIHCFRHSLLRVFTASIEITREQLVQDKLAPRVDHTISPRTDFIIEVN